MTGVGADFLAKVVAAMGGGADFRAKMFAEVAGICGLAARKLDFTATGVVLDTVCVGTCETTWPEFRFSNSEKSE